MSRKYLIRFNTNATSDENCWRILDGEEEILADKVEIKTHSYTSKDYIEGVGFKYHISCEGKLHLENGIATISD